MPGANHKFVEDVCANCKCNINSRQAGLDCTWGHDVYSGKCIKCNCLKTSVWYKEPCIGKERCPPYEKSFYRAEGGRRTRRSRTRRSRTRRSRRSRKR